MRKILFVALVAVSLLLVGASAASGVQSDPTYSWDGRGSDSRDCSKAGEGDRPDDGSGWIHWVFSTKGTSTNASLTLGGSGSGTFAPGEPLNANVWHFYTPFVDLAGLTASITLLGGDAGTGGGLVISDFCPGEEERLEVTKTAETSYEREHFWDIDKKVETEDGYELPCDYSDPGPYPSSGYTPGDDCPKIWLFTDGRGDETAEWTVDVTYGRYEDSKFNVSGEVSIDNTGNVAAVITDIDDVLAGTPIDLDCGVALPYTLAVSEVLTCDYSENVASKVAGSNVATVTTERDVYVGSAAVMWGDPSTEKNKTVNVDDVSDLFPDQYLGQATAPNSAKFTYQKDFSYSDYRASKCGAYRYDNTATIRETGQSADATLLVNVQCVEFKGETAWAANGDTPRQLRYTQRGNWATYVAYSGVEKTTTLFAGQTLAAGNVTFTPVGDQVKITVVLAGEWDFKDSAENLKVQDYATAPSGNPNPGGFAHKKRCDAANSTCEILVPRNNFYGVHLDVGTFVPDPTFGP